MELKANCKSKETGHGPGGDMTAAGVTIRYTLIGPQAARKHKLYVRLQE